MKRLSLFSAVLTVAITGCAEEPAATAPEPAATNVAAQMPAKKDVAPPPAAGTPAAPGTISVQEMLVSGPTQLKLHSLAMISQGNVTGAIDASYLPGLRACAEDRALPLRSVSAQLLGKHYLQGQEQPNPEALELVIKLAKDESADVRFNAVYHGLTQIPNKSDEILDLLIEIASTHPNPSLYDRIVESLAKDRAKITAILDWQLEEGENIAIFEIYEDLTGKKPANAEKHLEMPSSRPHLFIFKGEGADPEASRAALEQALKANGIENVDVRISGPGENHVLLVKTYITKDHIAVKKAFAEHPEFKITQDMWLTPELEVQIEAMQQMRK